VQPPVQTSSGETEIVVTDPKREGEHLTRKR
jgi:hypothetical protein